MANEKRLIDANALIEALPVVTEDRKITLYGAVADFMIMISGMPTVDAVEVVRCKDCEYGMYAGLGKFMCELHDFVGKAYFYCADGERKTDERKADCVD